MTSENVTKPLDTSARLKPRGSKTFAGEENPAAPGREATAGVAPNGTESVQGKDEQDEEDFDFFRFLMESNAPPPGISATNRDWSFPEDYNHGGRY